jgi:MFS transporter, SP family, arabinose:H+ symporter
MRPNSEFDEGDIDRCVGRACSSASTRLLSPAPSMLLVRLYNLSPQNKGLTVAIGLIGTVVRALWAPASVGQSAWADAKPCASRPSSTWSPPSAAVWPGVGLLHGLPLHRRAGHRRVLGAGPGLHRGARSGQVARTAGGRLPAQRSLSASCWLTPPTTLIRLMHLGATEWRWQVGIAAMPAIAFLMRCSFAFPAARAGRPPRNQQR